MPGRGKFWHDETGASAVEYGLLVALIAAVIIGAVTILGQNISSMFTSVSSGIGTGS
jgi:pilus assembly protein Flp/PilA